MFSFVCHVDNWNHGIFLFLINKHNRIFRNLLKHIFFMWNQSDNICTIAWMCILFVSACFYIWQSGPLENGQFYTSCFHGVLFMALVFLYERMRGREGVELGTIYWQCSHVPSEPCKTQCEQLILPSFPNKGFSWARLTPVHKSHKLPQDLPQLLTPIAPFDANGPTLAVIIWLLRYKKMCWNKQNSKICTSVSVILNIFPKILPFSTTFMCEAFHDITWEVLKYLLIAWQTFFIQEGYHKVSNIAYMVIGWGDQWEL